MISFSEQQHTLIQYLLLANPGPVIRKIAEDEIHRLEELKNTVNVTQLKVPSKAKPCRNILTGKRYDTIAEAARDIRVKSDTLARDILYEKYKYHIVPIFHFELI